LGFTQCLNEETALAAVFIPADADMPRSGQCTDSPSEKSHHLLDDTPFVIDKL
jgi:hypothetical protein